MPALAGLEAERDGTSAIQKATVRRGPDFYRRAMLACEFGGLLLPLAAMPIFATSPGKGPSLASLVLVLPGLLSLLLALMGRDLDRGLQGISELKAALPRAAAGEHVEIRSWGHWKARTTALLSSLLIACVVGTFAVVVVPLVPMSSRIRSLGADSMWMVGGLVLLALFPIAFAALLALVPCWLGKTLVRMTRRLEWLVSNLEQGKVLWESGWDRDFFFDESE